MTSRTPPTPSPENSLCSSTAGAGPAVLLDDGLDLRRFASLSPLEQLDKLEADGQALGARERQVRAAEAELKAKQTLEGNS